MSEEEEPSIEEILASIRQIISDDDEEEGEGAGEEAATETCGPAEKKEEVAKPRRAARLESRWRRLH